jgi:branched-subunit amino acid aminotransferase/4-amino-4-deoxychorismate lyase
MKRVIGDVIIDGSAVPAEAAAISVFDIGFQRGYGCFEAMRSYGGRIFRRDGHLRRLARSAARMGFDLPDAAALAEWCTSAAEVGGDCVVRLLVSGGTDPANPGVGSRVIVYAEPLVAVPDALAVQVRSAPWHPDGQSSELTGAKTLSYGPNVAAGLAARRAGFDDALLVGRDGAVLEGPTFSVGWMADGTLSTPSLELGVLASITRSAALEVAATLGVPVSEGTFTLETLLEADEVLAMSTLKEIRPIGRVDERAFAVGPVTKELMAGFADLVAAETAS